jgi:hypothetical protein
MSPSGLAPAEPALQRTDSISTHDSNPSSKAPSPPSPFRHRADDAHARSSRNRQRVIDDTKRE